jgi:hypothetical protein
MNTLDRPHWLRVWVVVGIGLLGPQAFTWALPNDELLTPPSDNWVSWVNQVARQFGSSSDSETELKRSIQGLLLNALHPTGKLRGGFVNKFLDRVLLHLTPEHVLKLRSYFDEVLGGLMALPDLPLSVYRNYFLGRVVLGVAVEINNQAILTPQLRDSPVGIFWDPWVFEGPYSRWERNSQQVFEGLLLSVERATLVRVAGALKHIGENPASFINGPREAYGLLRALVHMNLSDPRLPDLVRSLGYLTERGQSALSEAFQVRWDLQQQVLGGVTDALRSDFLDSWRAEWPAKRRARRLDRFKKLTLNTRSVYQSTLIRLGLRQGWMSRLWTWMGCGPHTPPP